MSTLSARSVLVFGALCLAACSSKSNAKQAGGNAAAGDDGDAVGSSAQASRIEEMLYSPVTTSDPAAAASSLAAAQWWPAGCATRSKDPSNPSVVHIHLTSCTGPFGIRSHSGDITVVFSATAGGGLHAQATSSDMTINGHPVTFSRDADITVDGTTRTVHSTGAWTRVNDGGETVSHTGDFVTVLDTAARCRTTNGTGITMVGSREIDASVRDYKLCRKADGTEGCPSGEVTHVRKAKGDTVTIKFDGSAQAAVTGPRGETVEVELVCLP